MQEMILKIFSGLVIVAVIFQIIFSLFFIKEPKQASLEPIAKPAIKENSKAQNGYKEFSYYAGFIKPGLFKLPFKKQEQPEMTITISNKTNKSEIDVRLEGIIWGGADMNSVVVLKNKKTAEIVHAKKGDAVNGWQIRKIDKTQVELVKKDDPSIIKILNVPTA